MVPGPGSFVPSTARNQAGAQHAVRDHFVEHIGRRVGRIHVSRIYVPRNDREEVDVLLADRAAEAGAVANRDFVKGPILDHCAGQGRYGVHDGTHFSNT